MSTPSEDGIVFRTDANLRPEGRQGPLTRTLASYTTYYDEWARTWEFQALVKARPVAGDRELGERFMAVATPRVWPEKLDPDAIREIRAMKERAEEITERKGIGDRELKRGRGGIRDIEFAVQLLQLVHGRDDATVRSPTTLDALHELADGGYVERADADRLDRAYQFLRTVEHRLQLYDEQQTHLIPSDARRAGAPRTRARLPRRPGAHRAGALRDRTPPAPARGAQHPRTAVLRAAARDPRGHRSAVARGGRGTARRVRVHRRRAHTRAAVRELAAGLTRRSRVMRELLP